jgi:hypothetical protein
MALLLELGALQAERQYPEVQAHGLAELKYRERLAKRGRFGIDQNHVAFSI